jgi:FkbM family methyltransferase
MTLGRLVDILAATPTSITVALDSLLAILRSSWRGRVRGAAIETLLRQRRTISHNGLSFSIFTPNAICEYRAQSFSYKEPETLRWIDEFIRPQVIWDVGANIGLYSLYAAKRHGEATVYAFEPSFLNLELLAKNIHINGLEDRVCIVSCPMFSMTAEDLFRLQSEDRGGALSAFAVDYGYDNKPLDPSLTYKTLGVSMNDMVEHFKLPHPDHIKIDVDGVEHLILQGGSKVLSDPRLKSILVELNDDFSEQKSLAESLLTEAGFTLAAKLRSESEFDAAAGQVWNCIWVRS